MKEYIEKKELKKLEQYQFGVSMCNIDEYVKISDIDKMPTLTEQEVTEVMQQLWKKKGVKKFAEKLKEHSIMMANSKEFYNNPQNGEYVEEVVLVGTIDKILSEMGCSDE